MKKLNAIATNEHEFDINWKYENGDEDMRELGEDIQAIINLPVQIQSNLVSFTGAISFCA